MVNILGVYTAIFSLIVLFFIVVLSAECLSRSLRHFKGRPHPATIVFLVMALLLAYLKMFVYPHAFFWYLDDYYPLEAANKIAHAEFGDLNERFVAVGLLFTPAFALIDSHVEIGFLVAIILSTIALFLLYMFASLVLQNQWAGLATSMFTAFLPSYTDSSLSTYTFIPSFLFCILGLLSYALYSRFGERTSLYLSMLSLTYATLLRMESIIVASSLFALLLIDNRKSLSRFRSLEHTIPLAMFLGALGLALITHGSFVSNYENYSFARLDVGHFYDNVPQALVLLGLGIPLSVMVIVGFSIALHRKNWHMISLFFVGALLTCFYLFLDPAHISGKRHFLFPSSIFFMLIGCALHAIVAYPARMIGNKSFETAIYGCVAVVFCSLLFLNALDDGSAQQGNEFTNTVYFDTHLPDYFEKIVPPECVLVSPHHIKLAATTNFKTLFVGELRSVDREQIEEKCYLLVEDLSCRYPEFEVRGLCDSVKKQYDTTVFLSVNSTVMKLPKNELFFSSSLYRIHLKQDQQ